MDLLRLDASTWRPVDLVDAYSTAIWTERFRSAGDFQLTAPAAGPLRSLLPLGTMLTLSDSPEIMIVEDHAISTDDRRGPILKVSGRSILAFLENRTIVDNKQLTMNNVGTPLQQPVPSKDATEYPYAMVAGAITRSIGVESDLFQGNLSNGNAARREQYSPVNSQDIVKSDQWTWSGTRGDPYTVRDPDLNNPAETGPNTWLTYFDFTQYANTYEMVLDALNSRNRGIIFCRPGIVNGSSVPLFLCKDPGDKSTNLDPTTSFFPPIVFDVTRGDLMKVSYFWNNQDYRNIAYVIAPPQNLFRVVAPPGQSTSVSGLNRRVLNVQVDNADQWVYQNYPSQDAMLAAEGRKALAQHNRQVLVDATVDPNYKHSFGYEYWAQGMPFGEYTMGDYVTVKGEYGTMTTMQVAEYIRSEDIEGDTLAYPTLQQIDYLV